MKSNGKFEVLSVKYWLHAPESTHAVNATEQDSPDTVELPETFRIMSFSWPSSTGTTEGAL